MINSFDRIDCMSHVQKDGFSLSVFALFDVFLIALLFTLFSSKFILAPGVEIDLEDSIALPKADSSKMGAAVASDSISVLNLRGKGMVVFDGKIYNPETFARFLQGYKPAGSVLLIKSDSGVSSELLLEISAAARGVGFKKILLAAEPK